MANFIIENNEKKALKHAYKKLLKKINAEIIKAHKNFGSTTKEVLILGRNYAHLLMEVAERSLDTATAETSDGIKEYSPVNLDSLNLFDQEKSDVKIWGLPVYVTLEDDVVLIVMNMSGLVENPYMRSFRRKHPGGKTFYGATIDMEALIADLPPEKRVKKIS